MNEQAPPALPAEFADRAAALFGDGAAGAAEASAFLASFATPAIRAVRANRAKASIAEVCDLLGIPLDPVPWCGHASFVPPGRKVGGEAAHAAGLFYVQEPSALAVGEALDVEPHHRVVDLAAAPGGKATHAASLVGAGGVLVANEVDRTRGRVLVRNLEAWGTARAVVTAAPVDELAAAAGPSFDRAVLDVPCSGEALFRRDASAARQWKPSAVRGNARRQAALLAGAAGCVAAGGVLVYSTCTFAPEENEQQVARFLDARPGWSAVDLTWLPGSDPSAATGAVRYWPHRCRCDGHFVAALRAPADVGEAAASPALVAPRRRPRPRAQPVTKADRAAVAAFWADHFDRPPPTALLRNGPVLYEVADERAAALPRLVRAGSPLGRLEGGRFEPVHALALRTDAVGAPGLEALDPAALAAFRSGAPVERDGPSGWVLVGFGRWPVGWGHRAGGVLRPRLPGYARTPPP